MFYFIIITVFIFILFLIWFILKKCKKKKIKIEQVEINFQDTQSLNVSKIIIEENDIDFTRNEFWFQYKQKQKLNKLCFEKLKKNFEELNQIKINDFKFDFNLDNVNILEMIEIIISDSNSVQDTVKAFYILDRIVNN